MKLRKSKYEILNIILSSIKKYTIHKHNVCKVAVDLSRRQSVDDITFNNYSYEYVRNDNKLIYTH